MNYNGNGFGRIDLAFSDTKIKIPEKHEVRDENQNCKKYFKPHPVNFKLPNVHYFFGLIKNIKL
jgi:hypothetical protein